MRTIMAVALTLVMLAVALIAVVPTPAYAAGQTCQVLLPGWAYTQFIALQNSNAQAGMYCPYDDNTTNGWLSDLCIDTMSVLGTGAKNLCTLKLKQDAWYPIFMEKAALRWGFPMWKEYKVSSYNVSWASPTNDSIVYQYPGNMGRNIIFAKYDSTTAATIYVVYHKFRPRLLTMPQYVAPTPKP